jgi:hypothetical protein
MNFDTAQVPIKELRKDGNACRDLLDERMRDLTLNHVQIDEVWTFVQKKQSQLTIQERADRGDIGDMYLWIGLDESTKVIPFAEGKRSADIARRLVVVFAPRPRPKQLARDTPARAPACNRYSRKVVAHGNRHQTTL